MRAVVPAPPRTFDLPLPAFAHSSSPFPYGRAFATSTVRYRQQNREKNKRRGVSAIRSTGPRVPLRVYQYDLPRPVEDPQRRSQFKTNENHGLWGFFSADRRAMISPEEESSWGRHWTYQELSVKDWDDLHKLYWTCILESNRTLTRAHEMRRVKAGYGENEAGERLNCIKMTMQNIRDVLRDRHVNYTEARNILELHEDAEALLTEPLEDEPLEEVDDTWQETDEHTPSQQVLPPDLTDSQPPTQSAAR